MPDIATPAAPQPAPTAQSSGEVKQVHGAENATVSQFARRFLTKDAAPITEPAATTQATAPETPAPTTEAKEAQTPPAETPPETPVAEEAKPEEVKVPETVEAKDEADDVLSPETSKIDPDTQEKINRRIGKEVAKRKDLERQLNELKVQMLDIQQPKTLPTEQPQIAPLPIGTAPLANINDINGLLTLQTQAKEAKRWAQEQLDRDDLGDGVQMGDKLMTKADLKSILRNATVTLEDHIPSRAGFLQQRNQMQQQAYAKFPFLADKASPQYLEAQTLLRNPANAWLHNLPGAEFFVGAYVKGMQALAAEESAKAKPAKAAAPKPKPAGDQTAVSTDASPTRVPVTTLNRQAVAAEDAKLTAKHGVSAKEYAAALAAKTQLRNSR